MQNCSAQNAHSNLILRHNLLNCVFHQQLFFFFRHSSSRSGRFLSLKIFFLVTKRAKTIVTIVLTKSDCFFECRDFFLPKNIKYRLKKKKPPFLATSPMSLSYNKQLHHPSTLGFFSFQFFFRCLDILLATVQLK